MSSQYRHRRTSSPSTAFPATLEPGEIAVNTANRQLALGDADGATIGAPLPLLTIRYFDARAQYVVNDYVMNAGIVYRANGAIPPGAFNASNWTVIANPGTFVLKAGDTMTGHLSLPTAPAAGNAVRKDYVDAADTAITSAKVSKTGDTMSGFLTLHADPDAPLKAATKQYVDAKPPLVVSDTPPPTPADNLLWWDSDSGTLYVRYNDGVGTPQWVQAVALPAIDTAAFLQKTGDTMTGPLNMTGASPITLSGNPTVALHAVPKQYADAPVDEKSYARRGATWAEVPRYQRISLAGGRLFDVQVPAGAVMARLTGLIAPTTAASFQLLMQLSFAAGVFRSTAGDYSFSGFGQTASAATIGNNNQTNTVVGMYLGSQGHAFLPTNFDVLLQLKRSNTSAYFTAQSRMAVWASVLTQSYYNHFVSSAAAGSALDVLAFRLVSAVTTDNWGPESYLHVEWL